MFTLSAETITRPSTDKGQGQLTDQTWLSVSDQPPERLEVPDKMALASAREASQRMIMRVDKRGEWARKTHRLSSQASV